MTSTPAKVSRASEVALDGGSFALFALFVAFLFVGYLGLYPSVPFSGMGAACLFLSLAVLFTANWRAVRRGLEPSATPAA